MPNLPITTALLVFGGVIAVAILAYLLQDFSVPPAVRRLVKMRRNLSTIALCGLMISFGVLLAVGTAHLYAPKVAVNYCEIDDLPANMAVTMNLVTDFPTTILDTGDHDLFLKFVVRAYLNQNVIFYGSISTPHHDLPPGYWLPIGNNTFLHYQCVQVQG